MAKSKLILSNEMPRLGWRLQNLVKRLYRRRSLFLAALLFFLSLGVPLFAAQVSASTSIVQTQQNPSKLIELAKALYEAGQFEEAAQSWQHAASAFAALGDRLNQAMALSNFSLSAQQLGKWEQAKEAIASSLNLLETHEKIQEQSRILASTLDIQGQLQLALGHSIAALKTWQQSTDIYENIGDRDSTLRSRINQAQAMQELGLYPRACKTLLKALELDDRDCEISQKELQTLKQQPVETRNFASVQILGLRSLGNVLRVIGQLEQSQMVLLKSWQLAQQLSAPQELASIYLSLGNTTLALGNRKLQLEQQNQQPMPLTQSVDCIRGAGTGAVGFYQQAANCYRQAESSASPNTRIQAQLNLLSLLVQTRQWSLVPTLLSKIQSHLNNLPASRPAVYAQINLAQSLMCLRSGLSQERSKLASPILQQCTFVKKTATTNNDKAFQSSKFPSWQEISQILTVALNQAQSLEDKLATASAIGYLGGVYQQMGKLAEAQQLTELALQKISAIEAPSTTYLWQWQLGRLRQIQGDQKSALQAYTLAFETLQSLRRDLAATNPEIQFTFRDSVEPVYRELVDLILQPENLSQDNQDNLKQARNVIEALQLAELNNFFQEACLDAQLQPIDRLDPNAAVFYSIILPERLAVILSLPGQPLRYYATALPSNSDEGGVGKIERIFDDLFATLNPFISSPEPLRPQQLLYDWLIRPAEAELERSGVKTLVFVLDGVLRGVPMAALHDGQQYLIEKYNIALTPGLQLLNPRSLSSNKLKTLVAGLSEARQGFSALPGIVQEVKDIASVVPTEVLLNQNFTRSRLETQIETAPFPVVHLATHGQFSSQAENTFLLTWDDRINVKELDQLLQERERQQRSPIELLILSACQTAAGDKRAALGLAGVAVRSGARSTLATLWSVQDQSTAELMTKLYSALSSPGVTKAEALRKSQLSLLRSEQYQHPFYWACFVLVGNWL
jgi:CHAT domain-containing protein